MARAFTRYDLSCPVPGAGSGQEATMLIRLALAAVMAICLATSVFAAPKRIIILRGGEAADDYRLCSIGKQRAEALKYNYLGKDAAKSLFDKDEPPAFFFATTPSTAELVTPAVTSWNKPIILYSVLPQDNAEETTKALDERTRAVTANILTTPALKGKTVVMVWEQHHIADPKLDADREREEGVTLRKLFRMDILPGVPAGWPDDTYDYFWILDFPDGSNVPSKFTMAKQEFGKSFPDVPANDWGKPAEIPAGSGCETKP
jgi:hypothetical protein